ncbi:hypothetical protein AgCh_019522 [Apium graveolens]
MKGKTVGLYFSASWCGPCRCFTLELVEVCNDVSAKGGLEIVSVSADETVESFNEYFSKMPWLAVPFSDSDTRHKIWSSGVQFTSQRLKELKEQEEETKRNQSLISILVSHPRDFVISREGKAVPVTELQGKTIGLYFSLAYKECVEYTIRRRQRIIKQGLVGAPWLSLPFKDKSCYKLARHFEVCSLPTLVILGPDGETLHLNVVDEIHEHEILAYPFTPERFTELEMMEKAKPQEQTLESILVSEKLDFVSAKDAVKVRSLKYLQFL